jgi:LPS-assembly lipoprotein
MWSREGTAFVRLAVVGVLALGLAGCFRPVYGGGSAPAVTSKGSVGGDVASQLAAIDVKQIDGRVGGKLRNELIFMLRGGGAGEPTAYRLTMKINQYGQSAIADPLADIPETRTITLTVDYELARAGTIDPIATGHTVATATFFTGLQRFANVRAQRDAEDRAATQAAERVRARLQAYFATGR